MNAVRILLPVLMGICLAGPVLAQSGPPAPEVQVLLIGPGFEGEMDPELRAATEASSRLLVAIEEGPGQSGWFVARPWPDSPVARECHDGTAEQAGACVRAAFQRAPEWRYPPTPRAFISYRPVAGGVEWSCTGIGERPTNERAQLVRFRPSDWSDPDAFWAARRAAAGCVLAAAAESGW